MSEAATLFLSRSGPIDWWAGWMTLEELAQRQAAELEPYEEEPTRAAHEARFLKELRDFQSIAADWLLQYGWEGDGAWRVSCLPNPERFEVFPFLAVKQGNNGLVHYASFVPLPWLESLAVVEWRSREYDDYLRSEVWQRKREGAIERAGGRCSVCNRAEDLQVHHRRYAGRWGEESSDDLTVLCAPCHGVFHSNGELAFGGSDNEN